MRFGEAPLSEITLRKYEKPDDVPTQELLKKFCMSVGLLQPGDGRELLVDVFDLLLNADGPLTLKEIHSALESRLSKKVAPSGVRRHLRRLVDLKFVEGRKRQYRIFEGEKIDVVFREFTRKYVVEDILARIDEYAVELAGRIKK